MLAKSVSKLPKKPMTLVAQIAAEVKSKGGTGWYEITLPVTITSTQRAETARQLRRVHGLESENISGVLYVRVGRDAS